MALGRLSSQLTPGRVTVDAGLVLVTVEYEVVILPGRVTVVFFPGRVTVDTGLVL